MFEFIIILFLGIIGCLIVSIWESVKNIDKLLFDKLDKKC